MKNTPRLSATGISTYAQCQRKFYYRHIEKLPEKPSPHLVRGRIVHKVIDSFFDTVNIHAISEESDWHEIWKQFRSVLHLLLDAEWKLIGTEYEDCFTQKEKEEFLADTRDMLDFYSAKLAFSLHSKVKDGDSAEKIKRFFYPRDREFKLELIEENMIGFVDKTMSLLSGDVAIVDYKTSRTMLPHFISETDLKQCKVYAYLWKKMFGKLPKHISIFYLRDGESVYYPITEKDLEEIAKDIADIRGKDGVKEKFPKNATVLCNYCDFWSMCFRSRDDFESHLKRS
jgi:putative RecB family exonuclease